jgi:hypothetical protein
MENIDGRIRRIKQDSRAELLYIGIYLKNMTKRGNHERNSQRT